MARRSIDTVVVVVVVVEVVVVVVVVGAGVVQCGASEGRTTNGWLGASSRGG